MQLCVSNDYCLQKCSPQMMSTYSSYQKTLILCPFIFYLMQGCHLKRYVIIRKPFVMLAQLEAVVVIKGAIIQQGTF